MQNPNTFTTKEQWYDWVNSNAFNVAPPPDKAVFHSGVKLLNYWYAEKWCIAQAKGHVTIERVGDGKILDQAKLDKRFREDRKYIDEIWEKASEKYAMSASGSVTCFVQREDARSVFRTIELPALLKNDKVTFINGIPREELENKFNRDTRGEEKGSLKEKESLKEIHEQIAKAEPKTLEPAKREEQKTFLDRDKNEESKQPSKETDGQRDKDEKKKTEPSKQEQDRLLSRIIVKEIDSDRADKRHFEVVLPSEKKLIFEMDAKAKGATPDRIKEGISFEKLNKLEAKQEGEIVNVNVKPRKPQSIQQLMREQDQEYERSR